MARRGDIASALRYFGMADVSPPIGPANDLYADYKQVTKFALTENANITALRIYLDGGGSQPGGPQAVKGLVYSDSGSAPATLYGVTSEILVPNTLTPQWLRFPFQYPVSILSGDYWLGFYCGADTRTTRFGATAPGGNFRWYNANAYSAAPSDSFGAPIAPDGVRLGMRAEYNTGFSPIQIPGLQAWFDAADDTSFIFGAGTKVATWRDKSGFLRHLTQATGTSQPDRNGTRNGWSTVVFDGTNDRMGGSLVLSLPLTICTAFKFDNADTADRHLIATNPTGGPTVYTSGGKWWFYSGLSIDSGVTDDSNWNTRIDVFNGASSELFLNGASIASGNTGVGSISTISLGCWPSGVNFWDGEVAEVLIYNSVLSAQDRALVQSYLQNKWATV